MTQFSFASLGRPGIGYIADSDPAYRYGNRSKQAVEWGSDYLTYEDGLTQHSPANPISLVDLGDFCASLASYLMASDTPPEHCELVERKWPNGYDHPSKARIVFLAGLKLREDKILYYSSQEEKTSTHDSKRHDKRWHQVPEYANGTAQAVYALSLDGETDFRDNLSQYLRYDFIRDTLAESIGQYATHPATWVVGGPEHFASLAVAHHYCLHFDQAIESMKCLMASLRQREDARRGLDCYLQNTRPRAVPTEETGDQQAA